jgi:hypothetical protein
MKLLYTIILITILTSTLFARNSPHIITADWQAALLYGSEWRVARFSGVKLDAGASVMGLIIADAYYVFYLLPEEKKVQLSILSGISNSSVLYNFSAAMVAPGAALLTSFKLSDRICLDLKLGAGFPLFFEKDKDIVRDISFPLDLWPDAGISIRIN